VDAIYIGPADLSVTLGLPPAPDQTDERFDACLDRVLQACKRFGVVPGIAGNAQTAIKRVEQGFRLVEVAADVGLLGAGAPTALNLVRGTSTATKAAYL
jgi:4-hydroxy-2-oxoheptanedioate aldolase